MPKPLPHSSNCVFLEGKIQEVLDRLDNISLQDLRQGQATRQVVDAIIKLQALKETLHESV